MLCSEIGRLQLDNSWGHSSEDCGSIEEYNQQLESGESVTKSKHYYSIEIATELSRVEEQSQVIEKQYKFSIELRREHQHVEEVQDSVGGRQVIER
jgi:hypothetical protein